MNLCETVLFSFPRRTHFSFALFLRSTPLTQRIRAMCCGFTECIDGETFSHGPFERKTVLLNVFLER